MIDIFERINNEIIIKNQVLTEEECFMLIVDKRNHLKTSVTTNSNFPINKMIRHSKNSFFEDDNIRKKIGITNKVLFQFTEYKFTGFYKWHRDDSLGRLYTHIIVLNKEYTGGELQI